MNIKRNSIFIALCLGVCFLVFVLLMALIAGRSPGHVISVNDEYRQDLVMAIKSFQHEVPKESVYSTLRHLKYYAPQSLVYEAIGEKGIITCYSGGYSFEAFAQAIIQELKLLYSECNNKAQLDLSGKDLANLDLSYISFRRVILSNTDLASSKLRFVDFSDGEAANTNFTNADLEFAVHLNSAKNANFSNANLSFLYSQAGNFEAVNFSGSTMEYAQFSGANFTNAIFKDVNLSHANFTAANFSNAQLDNLEVKNALFINTKGLSDAELLQLKRRGAVTDLKTLVARLRNGALHFGASPIIQLVLSDDTYNNYKNRIALNDIEITDIDMSGLDLRPFSFSNSNFLNVNLSKTNLQGVSFIATGFESCNFNSANMQDVFIPHSSSASNMSYMKDVSVLGANLSGADNIAAMYTRYKDQISEDIRYNSKEMIIDGMKIEPTIFPAHLNVKTLSAFKDVSK